MSSFSEQILLCQQSIYGWGVEVTTAEREKFQIYFNNLGCYLARQFTTSQLLKWWWKMLPQVIRLAYALKWRTWFGAPTIALPQQVCRVLKKEAVDLDSLKLTYCYIGLLISGRQKLLLPRNWQVIYLVRRWTSLVWYVPHCQINNQPLTEN